MRTLMTLLAVTLVAVVMATAAAVANQECSNQYSRANWAKNAFCGTGAVGG